MKTFIVTALVTVLFFAGCGKSEKTDTSNVPNNKDSSNRYITISNLNKSLVWKRVNRLWNTLNFDSTYFLPDTTISISVVTPDTLLFNGETYVYSDNMLTSMYDPTIVDTTIMYRYIVKGSVGPHSSTSLSYYHKKDSVEVYAKSGGLGGGVVFRLYTLLK